MSLGHFGDVRLDRAGAELFDAMMAHATVCINRMAEGERDDVLQYGRFLGNARVKLAQIVAGWAEETRTAVAGRHALAIQDTTETKFKTGFSRTT